MLSAFVQSIGYIVAGTGPLLFGVMHDVSGGWALPLTTLFVALGVAVVSGWGGAVRTTWTTKWAPWLSIRQADRMAWHRLEPADASLFTPAPQLHRYSRRPDVPPERVWESLASDESIAAWPMGPGLRIKLRWTSPRPFGIGTTREVGLPSAMTVRERFFRWDEGKGYSFYVESANRPGIRRFAEDYAIEPATAGSRFTWTIAIEPPRAAAAHGAHASAQPTLLRPAAAAGRKYFAQHG